MRFSHQHESWGRFNPPPCFIRSLLRRGPPETGGQRVMILGTNSSPSCLLFFPSQHWLPRVLVGGRYRSNAEGIDGVGSYELCQNELTACDWTQWNRCRHFPVCAA